MEISMTFEKKLKLMALCSLVFLLSCSINHEKSNGNNICDEYWADFYKQVKSNNPSYVGRLEMLIKRSGEEVNEATLMKHFKEDSDVVSMAFLSKNKYFRKLRDKYNISDIDISTLYHSLNQDKVWITTYDFRAIDLFDDIFEDFKAREDSFDSESDSWYMRYTADPNKSIITVSFAVFALSSSAHHYTLYLNEGRFEYNFTY